LGTHSSLSRFPLNAAQLISFELDLFPGVSMNTRTHNTRSFLGYRWPAVPRDYFARRRWSRKISTIAMIAVLSILLAGIIIYSSNPGSFSSPAR